MQFINIIMENNNNINQIKNPIVKGDIFSDYLINNSFQNSLLNQDFAKPDHETFDKYFNNDENSIKSLKSINSLNDFNKSNLNKSLFPEQQISDNLQINSPNNISNGGKDKGFKEEIISKDNNKKKNLFNTLTNKEITPEERKQKKLIMNRESAKKSRLKKKNYIENLEKQYILLKQEFIKIREEQKLNNNYNNNIQLPPKDDNQNFIINNNFNIEKDKNIENQNNILNFVLDNSDKNTNFNNGNSQKKLLIYLLINQIDIMTPIKIKAFQSKFLKMQILDIDDSIEIIKNKIDINLNTIIELYGIETDENNSNINIFKNKKSIAFQLYEFYDGIKSLINKFEIIFNNIEN